MRVIVYAAHLVCTLIFGAIGLFALHALPDDDAAAPLGRAGHVRHSGRVLPALAVRQVCHWAGKYGTLPELSALLAAA